MTHHKNLNLLLNLAVIFILIDYSEQTMADEPGCETNADYGYICGMTVPEDLVRVPDSNWVIASSAGKFSALLLINAETKAWQSFYPGDAPAAKQNMAMYGFCPGSPNPNGLVGHGISIRRVNDSVSMLYLVGHGEREAIEVFEVDNSNNVPEITWVGCVETPDRLSANSVVSYKDGSILATIPLRHDVSIDEIFSGKTTGDVYKWTPGEKTFTKLQGTEMRYPNGIEVSEDGKEFYIASSADLKFMAFSNTNPARLLRSSRLLKIIPDNLRWTRDGMLVTAGMLINDPDCGVVPTDKDFTISGLMSCPRSFMAKVADPKTIQVSVIEHSAAQAKFSNISVVIEVNDELWFGTFGGDRVAYTKLVK